MNDTAFFPYQTHLQINHFKFVLQTTFTIDKAHEKIHQEKLNQTLNIPKTENNQQTHKTITPFEIISPIITGPIEASEYAKLCTTGPVRTAQKENPLTHTHTQNRARGGQRMKSGPRVARLKGSGKPIIELAFMGAGSGHNGHHNGRRRWRRNRRWRRRSPI